MKNYRVAILGSGNIGTDLLIKILRSEYLECVAFIGKDLNTQGMLKAKSHGITCSDKSIEYIQKHYKDIDLVFDATSAEYHLTHAPILASLNIKAIDLTPAKVGLICCPSVNKNEALETNNINMITCGGQASLPIIQTIKNYCKKVDYVEVVSSIASKSAGRGTRDNLDEYINTTEYAIKKFFNINQSKVILNINPSFPCVNMQTTIFAKASISNLNGLIQEVKNTVEMLKKYVPNYQLISEPFIENDNLVTIIRVLGLGDYLPPYAGNLDIISCASILMAEEFAKRSNQ